MAVPTRKTDEGQLNEFNAWLKTQPWYQQFFASRGLDMNRVKLSRGEQSQLESLMAQQGVSVPSGMHIDQAGNLNQKNRLVRNTAIAAGAAAGAYFGGPALIGALSQGGSGVGAAGLGSGMNAATAGAAAHAGSPLLMGSGALTGIGAGAAGSVPTLASHGLFSGGASSAIGSTPSLAGSTAQGAGSMGMGSVLGGTGLGSRFANGAKDALGEGGDDAPAWLKAAMAGMAGLPGVLGNNGPGSEENELIAQAKRLLAQQEARTQYADPLYKATMQMAYGLLPNRPGGYPGGE